MSSIRKRTMKLDKLKIRIIKDIILLMLKIIPKETALHKRLLIKKVFYINSLDNSYYASPFNFLKPLNSILKKDFNLKSDTLFILGTGSSINSLSPKDFEHISNHDSLAFNNFLLHDFVPNFYLMESSFMDEIRNIQAHNIKQREADYKDVKFLFKGLEFDRTQELLTLLSKEKVNLDFYYSTSIYSKNNLKTKSDTEKELTEILEFSQKVNKNRINFCYEKRATLSHLLFWAYLLGYKKIVLCGVDLNHSKYFYETEEYKQKSNGLIIPPNPQTGVIHASNDPKANKNNLTIQEVIEVYEKVIFKPNNIELYISSKESALSEYLPIFNFNN